MNEEELRFYSWLAGFLDGEGCFSLTKSGDVFSARIQLSLRCDDWKIIREIYTQTGLGSEATKHTTRDNPQATWWVLRAQECKELARRLDEAGGLRAKKAQDYALWKQAVDLLCEYGGSVHGEAATELASLKQQLHDIKKFDPAKAEGYRSLIGVKAEGRPNGNRLMHYKKITQSVAEEIVRLRDEEGMTGKAIAEKFGLHQMSVSRLLNGYYRRVGGSQKERSRLSLEQIDTLVQRFRAGEKKVDLVAEYGCSAPQFYRYVNGQYDRRYHRAS